jgi:hypothetical protein
VRTKLSFRRSGAALCVALLSFCCFARPAFHLEDVSKIDGIGVDKQSGQLQVVLLVDKLLSERDTQQLVDKKLNNYCRLRRNGRLFEIERNAKSTLPVKLMIFHLPTETAVDQRVLGAIMRSAQRCTFVVTSEARKSIFKP